MNYRRFLPNLCTAMNLFFGMCSILSTAEGHLDWAAIFILLALVADGMDGRVARALGVSSEFGKEMDSLCDLGSFGIAPALLAWKLALSSYGLVGAAAAICFALCGMWRLTRFNVNANVVHGYFMGLAIPAGGNLVAMSAWLFLSLGINPADYGLLYPAAVAVTGYLMVSHVHYPDLLCIEARRTHRVRRHPLCRTDGCSARCLYGDFCGVCALWHRQPRDCADGTDEGQLI